MCMSYIMKANVRYFRTFNNTLHYIRDYVTEGGIERGELVTTITGTATYYVPANYVYYTAKSTLEGYSFSG